MSGERPFFLPLVVPSGPRVLSSNQEYASSERNLSATTCKIDLRIVKLFQEAQRAVRMLARGVKSDAKHTRDAFQSILSSMRSRLLDIDGQIEDTFTECLRLAMLSFHGHTSSFQTIQFRAPYLETRLKYVWSMLDQDFSSKEEGRSAFMFWIAVIAAGLMSLVRNDELTQRFASTLREHIMAWREDNKRLSEVMWTSPIHDVPRETTMPGRPQRDE